jgi:hypothetical protein
MIREGKTMYDFIDRPVTDLDRGGRFLVWAMRSWVRAASERQCPASAVVQAFGQWNMLTGLQPFLRIMAIFNRHGLEEFNFGELECNRVSEHEAIIISLIISLQGGHPVLVRQTLDLLAEGEVVGDLILALGSLGQAMVAAVIHPRRPVQCSAQWSATQASTPGSSPPQS